MKRHRTLLVGSILLALLAVPLLMGAAAVHQEHDQPEGLQFLAMVRSFLEFGRDYAEFCSNEEAVAVTAAMAIKDLHEKEDMDDAARLLNKLIEESDARHVRNALRMALKDVYEETGQRDKAAEQMAQLVRENQ